MVNIERLRKGYLTCIFRLISAFLGSLNVIPVSKQKIDNLWLKVFPISKNTSISYTFVACPINKCRITIYRLNKNTSGVHELRVEHIISFRLFATERWWSESRFRLCSCSVFGQYTLVVWNRQTAFRACFRFVNFLVHFRSTFATAAQVH